MEKNPKSIEELENKYLLIIYDFLRNNVDFIIKRLNSKNEIKKDWINFFKLTARENYSGASELDLGAERVIHNLFGRFQDFYVNSTPIGSDLMFETKDAYIHIEVKTATDKNTADYKGKIQIAQNQTSYSVNKTFNGDKYPFKASLPPVYSNDKVCLTYVIQIIHNNNENKPKIISLISIPNGLLRDTYGNCINAGKHTKKLNKLNSRGDIRFLYKEASSFKNLNPRYSRIKVIFPEKPSKDLLRKYLGLEYLNNAL
jgi:hypothetical protein